MYVEAESSNWKPWKTGVAYLYKGRPMMVLKQDTNEPCEELAQRWGTEVNFKSTKYRIEVHIYVNEWVTITKELMDSHIESIPGLATKLLIMVTRRINALAQKWFKDMIEGTDDQPCITFPCWKCYANIGPTNEGKYTYFFFSLNNVSNLA